MIINEYLPAKYFVELGLNHRASDHSSLPVFRDRFIKNGNLNIFEGILERIIAVAKQSGIKFDTIQLIGREACLGQVFTVKPMAMQAKISLENMFIR